MPSTHEEKSLQCESLTNDKTETKLCQVFQSLDWNVNKEDLDACQWFKDMRWVIEGKFYWKKDCEKVLKAEIFVNRSSLLTFSD